MTIMYLSVFFLFLTLQCLYELQIKNNIIYNETIYLQYLFETLKKHSLKLVNGDDSLFINIPQ